MVLWLYIIIAGLIVYGVAEQVTFRLTLCNTMADWIFVKMTVYYDVCHTDQLTGLLLDCLADWLSLSMAGRMYIIISG